MAGAVQFHYVGYITIDGKESLNRQSLSYSEDGTMKVCVQAEGLKPSVFNIEVTKLSKRLDKT